MIPMKCQELFSMKNKMKKKIKKKKNVIYSSWDFKDEIK